MKIKAAVLNGLHQPYEIEELELSEIRDDEVLVRIVASGMCHSDDVVRKGYTEYPMPIVLGHEGSGVVEQVGKNVVGYEPGDQVVISFGYCGHCDSCLTGLPASCDDWNHINFHGKRDDNTPYLIKADGTPVTRFFGQSSFSTHTIVSPSSLTKVDKSVDLRLVGPLGCGFLTGSGTVFNGLKPEPGTTIAIFGTGAVGLAAMMAAKISGCTKVIAVDIHDHRLERAKELGATHAINSKNVDVKEAILELTNGKGVNYSVDTTGVNAVVRSSIEVLAVGGSVAPVAAGRDMEINTTNDFTMQNRNLVGARMGKAVPQLSIRQMVEFYKAGNFAFDKLAKLYKFEDINLAAEESLSGQVIKPILIIDETYVPLD
ncbi:MULTISPECIES: NAD(P)-dependent alcohol dehydrogenase [unclassified Paenibacillus]|uniref:NAD(P)-dependent alcohol dehydrogenase n=1 Tax=Paenibacillus provencensis TaxID=441151 RepID=A0ABW3Q2E8_9BACL|nr:MULTISPECIES: NAD(P)-dependent alcohol dehydrogenase [unclassified Paenibacillus]MCM3127098.1 NAD(P)-dependent alcohol dehydrogenase [Paenibacillus sp. MER 78]SFS55994.1 aryl-alcohol dehydrogenase [Paenibacillus sp. 453mf]